MENGNKFFCDEEFEIVKITEDLYDEAVDLYKKQFMKYENIAIFTNLLGSEHGIKEMEMYFRAAIEDNVSFGAKHCQTNALVGMAINKIIFPGTNCTLGEVFAKFTSSGMRFVGEYLQNLENNYNLFKEWQIDCVFEIVFLSTHKDFGRKGIAFALAQHSVEYAKQMLHGTLPTTEVLKAHIKDLKLQAVCSVFSSRFSQKVGEKLGMETLNKVSHKEVVYEGQTFADKIDPIHEFSTFAALRL